MKITSDIKKSDYVIGNLKHLVGQICPSCNKGVRIKKVGPYGIFLGCSLYPICKYTFKEKGMIVFKG